MANGRFLTYGAFGAAILAVAGFGFWAGKSSTPSLDELAVDMADIADDPLDDARAAIMPVPTGDAQPLNLKDADRATLHAEIRNYILEEPEIIMEAFRILEQRRVVEEAQSEVDLVVAYSDAIFNDGFSYVGGNPEGSITLVEFQDYRCGYCKRAHGEVKDLIEKDGDIRLIVKEYPILGPDSVKASEIAVATKISQGDEAYKRINDAFMAYGGQITDAAIDRIAGSANIDIEKTRAALSDPQVKSHIAATAELGRALSVTGTPTFIIGNKFVRGYLPQPQMAEAVALSRRVQN